MTVSRRYHLTFVLLFSFLLNGFLPFFSDYTAMEKANLQSSYGNELVICTEMGMKTVSTQDIDQTNQHRPPVGGETHAIECGACYLAAHGLNLADFPAPLPLPVPVLRARQAHAIASERLTAESLIHRIKARAPPYLS